MSNPDSWERRAEETAKAYAAFCVYRDLGPQRSLLSAYKKESGKADAKHAPGLWTGWADGYCWKIRAEAYDAHCETLARKEREEAHRKELQDYRLRQKQLAQANLNAAFGLLQLGTKKMTHFQTQLAEAEKKEDKILVASLLREIDMEKLPAIFSAASRVSQAATEAEGTALGVGELLKMLEDDDDSEAG